MLNSLLSPGYILLAVILIIIALFVITYNRLVGARNMVDNAWHNIDTLLQKRYDLVPNLVNTVKGYIKHEKEVLENVTRARTALQQASSVQENASAENMLSGALKTLFAVSENYPDLKANQNFILLQEELVGIESKIAYARQHYNRSVMVYNTNIERFPTNLVAGTFNFHRRDFFQTESEEARRAVKVKF